jgi:hypothetical protein
MNDPIDVNPDPTDKSNASHEIQLEARVESLESQLLWLRRFVWFVLAALFAFVLIG